MVGSALYGSVKMDTYLTASLGHSAAKRSLMPTQSVTLAPENRQEGAGPT